MAQTSHNTKLDRVGQTITSINSNQSSYKRVYDIALISITAVLWIPFLIFISVLVYIFNRRPIFYTQRRSGLNGKIFHVIKFRTMVVDAEKDTGPVWATVGDTRVTKMGRILRCVGVDELPQIINIIKGEMSLVGPRPERPEFIRKFDINEAPGFSRRLVVRPGLVPLSHVVGRGDSYMPPRHRLKYDLIYIKRMSPWLDTRILFMAVVVIFQRIITINK